MRLSIEDWKEFYVGSLFNVSRGSRIVRDVDYFDLKDDEYKYPVITSTTQNNGVDGFYYKANCKGNTIVCGGEASGMFSTYQPEDCWVMDRARIFKPKQGVVINISIGLFLVSLFNQNQYKFSYGRSANPDNIEKQIIKLPICRDENNEPIIDATKKYSEEGYIPDFEWVKNYIKTLNHKPLTTSNGGGRRKNKLQLDLSKCMGFEIGKLFDIKNGMKYPSDIRESGNLPLVSTSASNNGVSDYIKYRDDSTYKNILTVAYSGSVGATFYHQDEVFVGETVFALLPKYNSNSYNGMFISFILNYHNKRYSYGRKIIGSKYGKDVIKLPIRYEDDGKTPSRDATQKYSKDGYIPDFKFMEDYIKSLPYGDKLP